MGEEAEGGGAPPLESEAQARALEEAQGRVDELTTRLKYLQAEVENTRKQAERDRREFTRFATGLLVQRLLPILDELDAALRAAPPGDPMGDGVRMVRDNLRRTLEAEGLQAIPTDGPFDPYLHDAVGTVEVDGGDEGHIMEVVQVGYRFADRILRPAQVVVARRRTTQGDANDIDHEDDEGVTEEEEDHGEDHRH